MVHAAGGLFCGETSNLNMASCFHGAEHARGAVRAKQHVLNDSRSSHDCGQISMSSYELTLNIPELEGDLSIDNLDARVSNKQY